VNVFADAELFVNFMVDVSLFNVVHDTAIVIAVPVIVNVPDHIFIVFALVLDVINVGVVILKLFILNVQEFKSSPPEPVCIRSLRSVMDHVHNANVTLLVIVAHHHVMVFDHRP